MSLVSKWNKFFDLKPASHAKSVAREWAELVANRIDGSKEIEGFIARHTVQRPTKGVALTLVAAARELLTIKPEHTEAWNVIQKARNSGWRKVEAAANKPLNLPKPR